MKTAMIVQTKGAQFPGEVERIVTIPSGGSHRRERIPTMTTQSADQIKQIIEAADVESFDGLEYRSDSGEYLEVHNRAGSWEEGQWGVTVDDMGQIWIDGDAVAESAQNKRVDALLEAGYSTELAQSQRFGYDDDAARNILG